MEYTVKEIAELTGVTIKTLYHYHKIGLLLPCKITEAGYRLYGTGELERLQQILFYRELDFSLKDIKKALEDEPSRLECLTKQHNLLNARRQRMDCLLKTIEESIHFTRKGVNMDKTKMFTGLNKEEWKEALSEQNEYLKDKYEFDMIKKQEIEPNKLNAQAAESIQFTSDMIKGLKSGWKPNDDRIQNILKDHIAYLNENVNTTDADTFVNTAKFMIHDDFHRNMLESQQTGLSYYLYAAAEMYADKSLNN